MSEKINGIKFSYQDRDNHIFGVYRIPEDIFPKEADKLVKEGKAQYENIDKYFELSES
ncbi:unnamed protein product [marine sediment metagenome]|uniref:Uncharacterized protein n=1 Tax=marine sediment metagenome TaxID=412755 RepID=X1HG40_9ZZZZ